MASCGHIDNNVIKATNLTGYSSGSPFTSNQEPRFPEDNDAGLTNDNLDVDHATDIVPGETTTTNNAIICVICLELVDQDAVARPCQHNYFHFSCLCTWLQQNRSCPLCKVEVSSIRYRDGKLNATSVFQLPPLVPLQSSQAHNRRQQHTHPRHRSSHSRRTSVSSTENRDLRFRRRVYENRCYSLYVGNNRISNYRNITPALFNSDSTLAPRARKWIRRELRALDPFDQYRDSSPNATGTSGNNQFRNNEFLLEYIVAILKNIDLKGSAGQAEVLLREHLGPEHARLFLHELENWLRSPFERLEGWDKYVQYAEAGPD